MHVDAARPRGWFGGCTLQRLVLASSELAPAREHKRTTHVNVAFNRLARVGHFAKQVGNLRDHFVRSQNFDDASPSTQRISIYTCQQSLCEDLEQLVGLQVGLVKHLTSTIQVL